MTHLDKEPQQRFAHLHDFVHHEIVGLAFRLGGPAGLRRNGPRKGVRLVLGHKAGVLRTGAAKRLLERDDPGVGPREFAVGVCELLAQLGVFAGYSIYFPELFPTRLRGTGVGFCYNTVRYLAAPAPALLGVLSTQIGFRNAAAAMAFVYIVGMVALIWAPETKGRELPED